jgi:glycosyltransferase involved in cell wall biosynthesis
MRLLFVHQNFPGQFLHLAPRLARDGHEVVALSARKDEVALPGVRIVRHPLTEGSAPGTHPMLRRFERGRGYGEATAAAALRLKQDGLVPDLIVAHPGWGEALFLGDVWPGARQLHYCEFHFRPFGPLQVFDASAPLPLGNAFEIRINSGLELFALDAMDQGYSPTAWQRDQYPASARDLISVIHDGINAAICKPDRGAALTLPSGRRLVFGDKVVTYVARNLEPLRGFPEFMRAMERLLSRRGDVEVVVIGGDEVSYGRPHPSGRPWREVILDGVDIDRSRVHFLGKVPYHRYLAALQISAAHVYLTAPFILSWSALEAMSAGCVLVASATEPVQEVVSDRENGLLVDFFDRDALVERVEECLDHPEKFERIRANARDTILAKYSLARCLPVQMSLVASLARQSHSPSG